MAVRILHCSKSLENYYLCLTEKISGFINRGPQPGDLIYLVVKVGKKVFVVQGSFLMSRLITSLGQTQIAM